MSLHSATAYESTLSSPEVETGNFLSYSHARYQIYRLEGLLSSRKDASRSISRHWVYNQPVRRLLITKFELQMTSFNAERNLMNLDLTDLTTLRSKLLKKEKPFIKNWPSIGQ